MRVCAHARVCSVLGTVTGKLNTPWSGSTRPLHGGHTIFRNMRHPSPLLRRPWGAQSSEPAQAPFGCHWQVGQPGASSLMY